MADYGRTGSTCEGRIYADGRSGVEIDLNFLGRFEQKSDYWKRVDPGNTLRIMASPNGGGNWFGVGPGNWSWEWEHVENFEWLPGDTGMGLWWFNTVVTVRIDTVDYDIGEELLIDNIIFRACTGYPMEPDSDRIIFYEGFEDYRDFDDEVPNPWIQTDDSRCNVSHDELGGGGYVGAEYKKWASPSNPTGRYIKPGYGITDETGVGWATISTYNTIVIHSVSVPISTVGKNNISLEIWTTTAECPAKLYYTTNGSTYTLFDTIAATGGSHSPNNWARHDYDLSTITSGAANNNANFGLRVECAPDSAYDDIRFDLVILRGDDIP